MSFLHLENRHGEQQSWATVANPYSVVGFTPLLYLGAMPYSDPPKPPDAAGPVLPTRKGRGRLALVTEKTEPGLRSYMTLSREGETALAERRAQQQQVFMRRLGQWQRMQRFRFLGRPLLGATALLFFGVPLITSWRYHQGAEEIHRGLFGGSVADDLLIAGVAHVLGLVTGAVGGFGLGVIGAWSIRARSGLLMIYSIGGACRLGTTFASSYFLTKWVS